MNTKSPAFHRRGRRVGAFLAVAAFALAAAGCSNDSSSPSAGAAPPAAAAVPSASSNAVSAQATSLGTILVAASGKTVYQFSNDKNGTSTCNGGCAANWPFVPAPASLPASLPQVTGKLGTTTRSDGARQLTVAGHPLYTFAGDNSPGQTNGEGINLDGGLWTAVSPAGAPVNKASTSGAATGNGY